MGWTGHDLPLGDWRLYTRGGLNGVFVQKVDSHGNKQSEEIILPRSLLLMLAAEDVRDARIAQLEQMDDNAVLGLVVRT